jgi:uncharacterized protein YndB with AHSA1/START domain
MSAYSSAVSRTDRASLVIDAPLGRTFGAFVDRAALETWLPPAGMSAVFERFDPRPGGSYRLVLTYEQAPGSSAKSTVDTDIAEARFVEIVQDERVVQEVDFVSDDPAFAGTMVMTWTVHPSDSATRVEFIAEHVVWVWRMCGRTRRIRRTSLSIDSGSYTGEISRWSCGMKTTSSPSSRATNDIELSPRASAPAASVVS